MSDIDLGFVSPDELFSLSVITGFVLGIIYDLLCSLKILFPPGKILTFIEDFLYMLFSGFVFFTFSVKFSGEIRYYAVAGAIAGWVIERLTSGYILRFVFGRINRFIKRIIINPVCDFITKFVGKIKPRFVKNQPKSENKQKVVKKPLKVE